jgi:hypothetical protein
MTSIRFNHEVSKQALVSALRSPARPDITHVIIAISIDGAEPELQINPRSNFIDKADYFQRIYNDDLELVKSPAVRVTDFCFSSDLPATLADWQPRGTVSNLYRLEAATTALVTSNVIKWLVNELAEYDDNDDRIYVAEQLLYGIRRGAFNFPADRILEVIADDSVVKSLYIDGKLYYTSVDESSVSNSPQSGTEPDDLLDRRNVLRDL